MKKYLSGFIVGIMFSLILLSGSLAFANSPIKLIVNGVDITHKSEVPPQIIDGRTVIPARALAEALGATVTWDNENRAVVVDSSANQPVTNEPMNSTTNDWISLRDLATKYIDNLEILISPENKLHINGKTSLISETLTQINLSNDGIYQLDTNLGQIKIKIDSGTTYLLESELKALGVI